MRMWSTVTKRLGAVEVVYEGFTTSGMFDRKSELVLDDQVISVENALTVKTSELGGLNYGAEIRVDGINYQVRQEPMRIGDGMLCIMPLMEIAGSAVTASGGIRPFSLGDLADVEIRDPERGDRLVYDGEKWVDEEEADGTNLYNGGAAE